MAPRISARPTRRAAKRPAAPNQEVSGAESASDSGEEYEQETHKNSDSDNDDENGTSEELGGNRPSNGPARKKRKGQSSAENNVPQSEDFEENALFRALSLREVAVADLVLGWIEDFEQDLADNTSNAITELFNLVLRACGCNHLVQPHDMISEDSAPATVSEIAHVFSRQRAHEYPFVSTNKGIKHFRQNVQQFFRSIVTSGHEKGSIYRQNHEEESTSLGAPLMNSVLVWLQALSESKVRPLRYVATVLVLEIQTLLCDLVSHTSISLQKQQRQLNSTKSGSGRNKRVQSSKIELMAENIDTVTREKNTLLEYIGEIFQQVYVNRYRDIDPRVREACLHALAQWMIRYEEMFLCADYLRYLGWLLSDPAESVKLEAVKLIVKLYRFINGRREAMSIGFRQFTERFKDQFIKMMWKEKLTGIKVNLLEILAELFQLGFLEDSEVLEICLLGFFLAENDTKTKGDIRARIEVCKFMVVVCNEKMRVALDPFKAFLETHQSDHFDDDENSLTVAQCLRYKALCELMCTSHAYYQTVDGDVVFNSEERKPVHMLIDLLFRIIYTHPEFQGQWEGLTKFVLSDFSAISFSPRDGNSASRDEETATELVAKLEISAPTDKRVFMSFIAAAILHILVSEPAKKAAPSNKSEDLNAVLSAFVKYISPLEEYLSKAAGIYPVFMGLWNSILITVPSSIARLYNNVADVSEYNSIHDKVLHYYFDVTSPSTDLLEAYDTYFSLILKNYEGSNPSEPSSKSEKLLNANIKMLIEDLLHSLATEGVDALLLSEPFEDISEELDTFALPMDQKIALNKLLGVCPTLQKFSQIARVINIGRYVAEPTLGTSNVLLEALQLKLVSKFDYTILTRDWPSGYANIMDQISDAWRMVLEFILISLSWKLEDLTYASSDNSAQLIDISLFLDDFTGLLISVGDLCVTVGTSAKELNEISPDSNQRMRSVVQNLVSLEHVFASHYIDMLAALRTFYDKFKGSERFKNFASFFNDEAGLGALVSGELPKVIQKALKRVFLIRESKLALLKDVLLDRQNDEDVNFDDFIFDEFPSKDTVEDDSENESPSHEAGELQPAVELADPNIQRQKLVWVAERDLSVYTLKLFSLIHSGALSSDSIGRIQLNSASLNGLFRKTVDVGHAQCGDGIPGLSTEQDISI